MRPAKQLYVLSLQKLGKPYCPQTYNCLHFVREVLNEINQLNGLDFIETSSFSEATDPLGLNDYVKVMLNKKRGRHVGFKFGDWFIHNSNRSCLVSSGVQLTPWLVIQDLYYPLK